MNKIQKIPQKDIEKFIDIMADAYPGLKIITPEDKKRVKDRFAKRFKDTRICLWGSYQDKRLVGGLILYDYTMNLFGHRVLAGGGGALAVDLMHKKQHVARDLMRFYFRHYRKQDAPIGVLWPFRPDFYRQMGCGLGSKGHVYRFRPADVPYSKHKKNVRFLGRTDMKAANDCYNRYVDSHHGMIEETLTNRKTHFDLSKGIKYAGFEKNGRIEGYMIFSFVRGQENNFVDNHIKITELIYETPEALSGLLAFLNTQFDQINRVILHTSDDNFHHLLKDPRNDSGNMAEPVYHESHTSGVGIMFRVLHTRKVFELLKDHNFGGQTLRLKLTVPDSFLKENDTQMVIHFEGGKPEVKTRKAKFDVELKLDIADFSSLLMGSVDLKSLVDYSLAEVSKADYIDRLDQLFATEKKPICTTSF